MDDDLTQPQGSPGIDDLRAAVREIDRHAARGAWNLPPRLYALVPTDDLLRAEPALGQTLALDVRAALTPVEQADLPADEPVADLLARIEWPAEVTGCAIVLETVALPPDVTPPEGDTSGASTAAWAATHPRGEDGRLTVGVLRNGARAAALRWRRYDDDADVVLGPELAPALADALGRTLDAWPEGTVVPADK